MTDEITSTTKTPGPIRFSEVVLILVISAGSYIIWTLITLVVVTAISKQHLTNAAFDTPSGSLITGIVEYSLLLFTMLQFARRRGDSFPFNLLRPVSKRKIAMAAGYGFITYVGAMMLFLLLRQVSIVDQSANLGDMVFRQNTVMDRFRVLGVDVALGPFADVLYWNGLLFTWLRLKLPLSGALSVLAILFGLYASKFGPYPVNEALFFTVQIGVLALVSAIWFVRTNSLWPSVAVTSAANATLMLVANLGKLT